MNEQLIYLFGLILGPPLADVAVLLALFVLLALLNRLIKKEVVRDTIRKALQREGPLNLFISKIN